MATPLVDRVEFSLINGEDLSAEKFTALYNRTLKIVRPAYSGDIDTATGRAADVIHNVFVSVMSRLHNNPRGARSLGVGTANVTFGWSDGEVGNIYGLTDNEARDLAALSITSGTAFSIRPGAAR